MPQVEQTPVPLLLKVSGPRPVLPRDRDMVAYVSAHRLLTRFQGPGTVEGQVKVTVTFT